MTHAEGTPSLTGIMALVLNVRLKSVSHINALGIIQYAQRI